MLWSLVVRNNKVFLRNKTLVFFTLLSVLILIGLYVIFLQELQVSSIKQYVPDTTEIKVLVSEWMIAGLLTIIAMSSTLGVFGIYIKDIETKTTADFLVTAVSRIKIQLSYVVSSLLIGSLMTIIGFICSEIYIIVIGGEILPFPTMLKVIGLLLLAVLMSSLINLFIVLFINSETTYSTISSLINTLLGFLCGIYVPMAVLPDAVKSIIHFFPVSHITVLLRTNLMENSFDTVFEGNTEYADSYKINYGVEYEIGGNIVSESTSLLFIVSTIVILGILSAVIYWRKHK